jgi:hypothetical protein
VVLLCSILDVDSCIKPVLSAFVILFILASIYAQVPPPRSLPQSLSQACIQQSIYQPSNLPKWCPLSITRNFQPFWLIPLSSSPTSLHPTSSNLLVQSKYTPNLIPVPFYLVLSPTQPLPLLGGLHYFWGHVARLVRPLLLRHAHPHAGNDLLTHFSQLVHSLPFSEDFGQPNFPDSTLMLEYFALELRIYHFHLP